MLLPFERDHQLDRDSLTGRRINLDLAADLRRALAHILQAVSVRSKQLILSGKLKAVKTGRDHLIAALEVEKARRRKTTRGPARKSNENAPAEHKAPKKKGRR